MPRSSTPPVSLANLKSTPGREFIASPDLDDNSFFRIARSVNTLWGSKAGAVVSDVHDRGEAHLTGDENFAAGQPESEYRFKTPWKVNHSGPHITLTLWVVRDVAFINALTSWTVEVLINGASQGIYQVNNGNTTVVDGEPWVVDSYNIDDTAEYNDITLRVVDWGLSMGSGSYVTQTLVYAFRGLTEIDPGALDGNVIAQELDLIGVNGACSTFQLQDAANMLINTYERRVPTLYSSARSGQNRTVNSTGVTEVVAQIPLEVPTQVSEVQIWIKARVEGGINIADTGQLEIAGASPSPQTVQAFAQELWYLFTFNMDDTGFAIATIRGFKCEILTLMAFCSDAQY